MRGEIGEERQRTGDRWGLERSVCVGAWDVCLGSGGGWGAKWGDWIMKIVIMSHYIKFQLRDYSIIIILESHYKFMNYGSKICLGVHVCEVPREVKLYNLICWIREHMGNLKLKEVENTQRI